MGVDIPGFIDDRILMLGSRQVISYLVMGAHYAWIGGGTAWGVPRMEEQLDRLEMVHHHDGISLDFADIHVVHRMGDGDGLDLGGGLSLQFFDTPGHSRCSMSVYLPERRILFPGDAIPFPENGRDELTVTANHDYPDYLSSLEKLRPLSIDMVAYEHGGILKGNDAEEVVTRGLDASLKQRQRIRARLRVLGDAERLVDETVAKYQTVELFRLLSVDVLKPMIRRMVLSAIDKR